MDNINVGLAPQDIYSGMYARVTLNFYPYKKGNVGVGCGLGNVLKTRDGEPLAGTASAASDFAGIGAMPATNPAVPGAPVAYGAPSAAPVAPVAPVAGTYPTTPVAPAAAPAGAGSPPWAVNNGINPITGLPM